MKKTAIIINYLLDNVDRAIASRSKEYTAELVRQKNNNWVYNVGDYLVRVKVPKIQTNGLSTSQIRDIFKLKNRDILVSCNCDFWKFNGPDFNAAIHDYSERQYSNLQQPIERDPEGKYLICKHVYAALKDMLKEFKILEQ